MNEYIKQQIPCNMTIRSYACMQMIALSDQVMNIVLMNLSRS